MRALSLRPPEQSANGDDPLAACGRTIDSVRRKADRNERLARVATGMIIITSALIPVSIIISTQGGEFAFGKLVPSILAALAATTAGVLQFERPHERWKLYRGYQRALEAERFRYENQVQPYDGDEAQRTRQFAAMVVQLQLHLHEEWSGLVPASAQVAVRAVTQSKADG
jgi:hypothetical protein